MLLQQFMGEKFGRDNIWEGHLATELWSTRVEVSAVLDEMKKPLGEVMDLKVGDTLMLDANTDGKILLRCGTIDLTHGRMGRIGQNIGVRLDKGVSVENQKSLTKFL